MRITSTTRIWKRSAPMRCRKPRNWRSCSRRILRNCPTKTACPLPLKSETVEDQAVEFCGMGEGAHMARTFEDRDCCVGQARRKKIDHGAGGRAGPAARDQQSRRGDFRIILERGLRLDDDSEFERDFGDGGGNR